VGVKLEDHIAKLLKRVDEWIAEQKETASLEKARVDDGKRPEQKRADRAKRGNDKGFDGRPEFSNFGDQRLDRVSGINVNDRKDADSGQSNKGKSLHILKELKSIKPNLPKSEPIDKARVDEGKTDYQKQAARADRAGSWEKENLGTAGSGHSKIKEITHFLHNSKLDQIKRSPKPNFPAEPVEKAIDMKQVKAGIVAGAMALAPHAKDSIKSIPQKVTQTIQHINGQEKLRNDAADRFGIKDSNEWITDYSYNTISGKHEVHSHYDRVPKSKKVTNEHVNQFKKEKGLDISQIKAANTEPVDKSIEDQMFYEKHKKQIHQEGKARRAAIEQKKSTPSLVEKLSSWINKPKAQPSQPQAPAEQKPDKLAASEKTPIVMTAKQAVDEHKELVHVLKTPSHKDDLKEAKEQGVELKEYKQKLDKSATVKKPHNLDLTHVATVETPKELHPFISGGHPVPYDHPHRELAAKFVTDVWRKNKPEGKRMSEKLLGIGENGKVNPAAKQGYSTVKAEKKDYAAPTPADISAPAIINERRTMTGRNYISGPDIISGYPSTVGESGQPKDKDMKKSELAKSLKKLFGKELDKAQNSDPSTRFKNETGVNKQVHSGSTGISGQGYTVRGAKATVSSEGNKGQEFRQPQGGPNFDRGLARDKAKSVLSDLKAMPKPNLPKSEKSLEKLDPMSHQPGTMLDKSSPEYLYKMKTFGDGLKKYCSSKMEKANNFEAKSGLKGQDVALKMVRATNPNSGPKGVHQARPDKQGKSTAGIEAVNSKKLGDMASKMTTPVSSKRDTQSASMAMGNASKLGHKKVLTELKAMPKPNLPKSEAPIAKSDSSLKKNSKFKELEAKLNAIMPSKPVNPEIQAAAKAKVAAGMQAKAKHDQMEKDRTTQQISEQKLKQDLLLPENIKLDRPKYLTLQQGHEAILNGKPNPMQEAGKNKPQHLDDIKLLNNYHGKNIITGVHDQPVKSWGNETYLMHPDGKLDFQHAEYDTSDARK